MLNGIRDAMTSLEGRMDRRFEQLEQRMNRRFEQVDARFAQMETRFSQVDQRIDSLDAKVSRQFVWLVGILLSGMIAMLGALAAAILGGQ